MPHARAVIRPTALARPLLLAALALSLLPLLAVAQEAPAQTTAAKPAFKGIVRKGFYVSAGLGAGQQRFEEDLGGGASNVFTQDGVSAAVRIGALVSPKVALSLDLLGFAPENGAEDDVTSGAFATATWFPKAGGGFLLRGGLGRLRTEREASPGLVLINTVGAIQLGAGYDIRIGRNKAIALTLDVAQGSDDTGTTRIGLLGAAISFY